MNELDALVHMSKYAGGRFDLIQAGGGNTSVKLDNGIMLIKASGFILSDVEKDKGYSIVRTNDIAKIVNKIQLLQSQNKKERERITATFVQQATVDCENRPSIETLLHSFMLKFTLHTHPIVVNILAMQKNWKSILQQIFKNENIGFVPYKTPGIELAISLNNELKNHNIIPNIIFLQNHGLIITSDNFEKIESLTENVLNKIESYLKIDMSRYKCTNLISRATNNINKANNIAYLSEDIVINDILVKNKQLFFFKPFCPDTLVYCGINTIEIQSLEDTSEIRKYYDKYLDIPKVIIFNGSLLILATNVRKAKEIEEVLKFHVMALKSNNTNINFLAPEEISYLSNWEAEKFRKTL